ncbi:MAG: hypothetical protein HYY29_03715 [Chloroflexi bacterium]|nr:hypothetical protein [Chloroflexota bacterium]
MDVANYQPLDLSGLIDQHQIEHVIVRAYLPWEKPSNEIAKTQIESARANGCTVGLYVWAYRANDPRETIKAAKAAMDSLSVKGILWVDCETYINGEDQDLGPNADWLRAAGEEATAQGVTLGIYSSRYWLTSFLPGYAEFGDWWLWLADYNNIVDLDSIEIPMGWNRGQLLGHQYSDKPIDLNVFDRRAIS